MFKLLLLMMMICVTYGKFACKKCQYRRDWEHEKCEVNAVCTKGEACATQASSYKNGTIFCERICVNSIVDMQNIGQVKKKLCAARMKEPGIQMCNSRICYSRLCNTENCFSEELLSNSDVNKINLMLVVFVLYLSFRYDC